MTKTDYWYPTAFSGWGDEERDAMQRVIASNRFTMGDETAAFEEELAAFNKRKHAICVNSGSSANLIAATTLIDRWMNSQDSGLQVSIPALAWATTYAPFIQLGFDDLVLRDCNDTWCQAHVIGSDECDIGINVSCSILGNPADWMILEGSDLNDDCEAFGVTIDSRPTASFGTIATQSFFWSHQLGAIEGGACLTDNDELAVIMRQLRDHGMDRTTRTAKPAFDKEYNFLRFGYNVRPVEMHMAIAREQLKKAHMHRTARRKNWALFAALVAQRGLPITLPVMGEGANPFGLHFTFRTHAERAMLAQGFRANGIDCRMPTGGSFRLHEYGKPWADQQTLNADRIHNTGLFLGNAPYDISEQIERAVKVMEGVLCP